MTAIGRLASPIRRMKEALEDLPTWLDERDGTELGKLLVEIR